jgi:hypothetical protein
MTGPTATFGACGRRRRCVALACGACRSADNCEWPRGLIEEAEQSVWYEPRARSIDEAVALRTLTVGEEALRHEQVQIVLGACHRDIEQSAFFGKRRGGKYG